MKPLTESAHRQAIVRARALIEAAGGRIDYNYTIVYGGEDRAVLEAIIFLVRDWDYEFRPDYRPSVFLEFWIMPLWEMILWCVMICSIVFLICHLIFCY
jgi:hypothetical protein